jgi:uncharacterized protein
MSIKMFVNFPVNDLKKSMAFFTALGFAFDPKFTDETAACMVISEHNYVMLLTHAKWKSFTSKPIADAKETASVAVALALDSRKAVDAMVRNAITAGGKEPRPVQDYGFMVQRTFEDLDGHTWEPFFMNPAHLQT